MRRTVVVDDQLLESAREALGTKGIRETIEAGLKEAVRRKRLEELRASLGKTPLAIDAKALEQLRRDD